ncbi:unnamed protein product, partial [Amoebophrya sp. A25]
EADESPGEDSPHRHGASDSVRRSSKGSRKSRKSQRLGVSQVCQSFLSPRVLLANLRGFLARLNPLEGEKNDTYSRSSVFFRGYVGANGKNSLASADKWLSDPSLSAEEREEQAEITAKMQREARERQQAKTREAREKEKLISSLRGEIFDPSITYSIYDVFEPVLFGNGKTRKG